jgi:malate permease and related proteins
VIRAILLDILAPILVLVALGALMRRKFGLDIPTLSKLNIYLFVPAFIFDVVSRSRLSWGAMGGVMLVTALNVLMLGAVVWAAGRALGASRKTLAAVALAVMFYNSGNYGIPLAALAFPGAAAAPVGTPGAAERDGAAVQAFVVLSMNLLTFTVGLGIAVWAGSGDWKQGIGTYFRLPMFPAVVAALLARAWVGAGTGRELPVAISKPAEYLALGLIPLALVTLGAQLAENPRWPRWRPLSMVLFLRLVYGPAQMAALLYGFHLLGWKPLDLWGPGAWPAASLILTAGVPTAINTLLLVLEVGGETELAADSVFWTTLASCVTITAWLVVIRLWT